MPNIAKYVLHVFFFFFFCSYAICKRIILHLYRRQIFLFQFRLGLYLLTLKHCIARKYWQFLMSNNVFLLQIFQDKKFPFPIHTDWKLDWFLIVCTRNIHQNSWSNCKIQLTQGCVKSTVIQRRQNQLDRMADLLSTSSNFFSFWLIKSWGTTN